ncbi:ATP-binding protein [Streptomyces sp. NPDC057638]|uniref:ATP-binding protein n=1 Tax=Streptomyces sp. NPDC057638 TaxID=3346190 RepID=UPI003697CA83
MSVPVAPTPRRIRTPRPLPLALPLASVVVAGAVGGGAAVAAPSAARGWVAATVAVAWLWVALTAALATLKARRLHASAVGATTELRSAQAQSAQMGAESAHLVNVTLPSVIKRLRDGEGAEATLADTPPPTDAQLRRVLRMFAAELERGERRREAAEADAAATRAQLVRAAEGLDTLMGVTLPTAVAKLRDGASADTALGEIQLPADPRMRAMLDTLVRDYAFSERRAAVARGASAKVLSRVQAKAVSMLADLRDLQDRHSGEVFGDLLRLDHNTSQLGMLTDRLALLLDGRASRAWNKPIGMESILRGAVGRIAAYRRVRLHNASNAAVAGYAAEGVMHLLAELMDNAANFSPPIDEVHVYVEERTAGLVVTIEDSGLKMSDAAMRRAEEAVAGHFDDLATLQSTRLGLVVVGKLATKYNMGINFRPSSRGGTGVVVLFPPQLLHQQAPAETEPLTRRPVTAARDAGVTHSFASGPVPGASDTMVGRASSSVPGTPGAPGGPDATAGRGIPGVPGVPDTAESIVTPTARPAAARDVPPAREPLAERGTSRVATPNGLPVRPPGRTMAAADRTRPTPPAGGERTAATAPPAKNAGERFGAFHRSQRRTPQEPPRTTEG